MKFASYDSEIHGPFLESDHQKTAVKATLSLLSIPRELLGLAGLSSFPFSKARQLLSSLPTRPGKGIRNNTFLVVIFAFFEWMVLDGDGCVTLIDTN